MVQRLKMNTHHIFTPSYYLFFFPLFLLYFLPLPAAVSQFLRDFLIAFFIKIFDDLQALFLQNSPVDLKLMICSKWAASSELVVELSKINLTNAHEIEGEGAHDARLYSHEENATGYLLLTQPALHITETVYLTVPGCILALIGEIVTGCLLLVTTFFPTDEHTSYRDLVTPGCCPGLFQGFSHPMLYLSFRQFSIVLHASCYLYKRKLKSMSFWRKLGVRLFWYALVFVIYLKELICSSSLTRKASKAWIQLLKPSWTFSPMMRRRVRTIHSAYSFPSCRCFCLRSTRTTFRTRLNVWTPFVWSDSTPSCIVSTPTIPPLPTPIPYYTIHY